MAKINRYMINLGDSIHVEEMEVIKVSELREWVEAIKAEIDDIEIVTEVERIIKRNKKEILNDLLVFFGTEEK